MNELTALKDLQKRVESLLQQTLDRREPALVRLPGLLGQTSDPGSAAVPGKSGWVYVRVGSDETLATAFNNRTPHRNGLPVIVGYDATQPTLFQVLSAREVYLNTSASGGATAPHHAQHEWGNDDGGEDIVWMRMRQLVDLMVYPTDPPSLSVNVALGYYLIGITVYHYAGGTLDLSSYVPSASKKWVLVACDENGPYVVDGIQGQFDYEDIPNAADPTHYKLAGVLLAAGDTAITDWPDEVRFVDLRLAGSRSISGSGGFVDWENVRIVAKSGGNYDTIAAAINVAQTDEQVLILPGQWHENINTRYLYIVVIAGLVDRYKSQAHGTVIYGADNTGPLVTLDWYCHLANLILFRGLSGGAGTYYGIYTDNTSCTYNIAGIWGYFAAGSTGRTVIGCKLVSNEADLSSITRCVLRVTQNTASGAVLELGDGALEVQQCQLHADAGEVALRVSGSGTCTIDSCEIDGVLEITGTATIYLRGCTITGDTEITGAATVQFDNCTMMDLTIGASGAEVYVRGGYINGDISVGTGDLIELGIPAVMQSADKTISGAGTIRVVGLLTELTSAGLTRHWFGPASSNGRVAIYGQPVGTVDGEHRSLIGLFFTDFLADEVNFEVVELLAFDDGVDVFGVLRTRAGGSGTLRNLWLGVGDDKSTYLRINSDGDLVPPDGATLDGVDLSAHAVDADAHHNWPLEDGDIPADIARDSEVTNAIAVHTAIDEAHHNWPLEDGDIPSDIARDSEVTAAIATHAAIDDVHHDWPLEDGDIPAGIARDSEVTAAIAAHAADDDAHHDPWLVGESGIALSLDFTGSVYDTKAECAALGVRFSDYSTPFPSNLSNSVAGTWSHVTGRGWQPAHSVNGEGPALLIPLCRTGNWELEAVWDWVSAESTYYVNLDHGYYANSNHVGAYGRLRDTTATAVRSRTYLYTNDGDDTCTQQYTGDTLDGPIVRTVKVRSLNGTFGVWDDEDDAWHDYEDRQCVGVSYAAAGLFIQATRSGGNFPTIYLASLKLTYFT